MDKEEPENTITICSKKYSLEPKKTQDGSVLPDEIDSRRKAKQLYWMGWRTIRIAEYLGENYQTICTWKRRDKWDDSSAVERVESTLESRLVMLIAKECKEGKDFKEIDLLNRQLERLARIHKYSNGGNEADLNPNVENRNKGPKKKPIRNEFSPEQANKLHEAFMDWMFPYQRVWNKAGHIYRIRDILKGRRIGGTRYFAREALDDALQTGRSQIWLSASKAQAHEAKRAIKDFALSAAEIELSGDPIALPAHCARGGSEESPTLYFLGTNALTAQGYGGNFIFDEYFWVQKFRTIRKVASAIASHKRFRQTYFSSPSAMTHEGYPFWSGNHYNRGRKKEEHVSFDVSHAALKNGMLCADGQWRQIVTVEDAVAQGCDLYDLDQLRLEYSPEEFAQLLMCEFIDDSNSVFSFNDLARCMCDSWEEWDDFKPFANRPLGNREVWLGYDPSDTGDTAALVVIAPPLVPDGKFRVLERRQFKGFDFEDQNQTIKGMADRYNVTFIGIDGTGLGAAVYQLVKLWFPAAVSYQYSIQLKNQFVLKAISVIRKGRLSFDSGWMDVVTSFLGIKKTITPSGRQATYQADRSEETSHSDLAWAIMHALNNEPLEGATSLNSGFMELF